MAEAAFNKKGIITRQLDFNLRKEISKMLHLEHSFIWCCYLETSISRPKISGEFRNVLLEKDGEDQLDRSCEI